MIGIGLLLLLATTHPAAAPVALPAPVPMETVVPEGLDLDLDLSTAPADLEAAAQPLDRGNGCGHARQCSAQQVGQPCNPGDLNVLCSQQSNGHYCCLAYAP